MVNQDKIRLQELSHKSLMGTITDAEKIELNDWLNQVAEKTLEIPTDTAENKEEYREYLFQRISTQTGIQPEIQPTKLWPKIAAVAAAIAFMVLGVYFFYYRNSAITDQTKDSIVMQDIAPGKQGATLTLANGQQIRLTDAANGEIANESGIAITKTKDGQLIYEIKGSESEPNKINTLTTARGETYQVRLPDGSTVFLNAASSLTYAASLIERGKRTVRLRGEGYFEISKDKAHPFVVKTDDQEVEVLGTHFNINSYADESGIKTTLLEGSVRIAAGNKSAILSPGQQSVFAAEKIAVGKVDAEAAVDWTNGQFVFEKEPLGSIMRKVERWYNVEVEYQDDLEGKTFSGVVSRFDYVSTLLDMLETTGRIHFEINGKRIIVKKK